MGGKHEPASKRSFWFSLTASTLKVVIIVGAVVVGVVVLARSFETVVAPTTPAVQTSPSTAVSPQPGGGTNLAPDDQAGVSLGVYNGTDTEGLAKDVEKQLRGDSGYSVVQVGNTTSTVDATTIYYVKSSDKASAEALATSQPEFADADVLRLPKGTTVIAADSGAEEKVSKDVQVAIFVGEDYAG